MTKKSHARLMRDAEAAKDKDELAEFFQKNKAWDDLNACYISIGTQFAEMYGAVLQAYQDPLVKMHLDPAKFAETQALLAGLSNDIGVFVEELKAIKTGHEGKFGASINTEEFQTSVVIFEKYNEIQVRFEGSTGRTIQSLMEDAAAAALRAKDAVKSLDDSTKAEIIEKHPDFVATTETVDAEAIPPATTDTPV